MKLVSQLIGGIHLVDRTWCCDRCRAAALALEHAPEDKQAGHHGQTQQDDDKIAKAGLEVIERRS